MTNIKGKKYITLATVQSVSSILVKLGITMRLIGLSVVFRLMQFFVYHLLLLKK